MLTVNELLDKQNLISIFFMVRQRYIKAQLSNEVALTITIIIKYN